MTGRGDLVVRRTGAEDHRALALLRALWTSGGPDPELEQRMADWLAAGDDRLLVRPRPG